MTDEAVETPEAAAPTTPATNGWTSPLDISTPPEGVDIDLTRFKGKTAADLLKSYAELQKLQGKMIHPPKGLPEEDPDAWAKIRSMTGVPEKPEDYALPSTIDAAKVDADFLNEMRTAMHAAGIPSHAFARIVDAFYGYGAKAAQAEAEAKAAAVKAHEDTFRQEWGATFHTTGAKIQMAIEQLGGQALRDAIDSSPLATDPTFTRAMAKVANLMSEDRLLGKPATGLMSPADAATERARLIADKDFMSAMTTRGHPDQRKNAERLDELGRMMSARGD